MSEYAIKIPRSSPDATEATLIDMLVEEGGQAIEGEPLFSIATDKVEIEIEAGASGTVHWTGQLEVDYDGEAFEIGFVRGQVQHVRRPADAQPGQRRQWLVDHQPTPHRRQVILPAHCAAVARPSSWPGKA